MAKILITPFNWFEHNISGAKISGGERFLERLCDYLISKGHEIKAVVGSNQFYMHNGIECHPQGEGRDIYLTNNDIAQWADVHITQLIGTTYGVNKAHQHKKPLIFIAHNNSEHYNSRYCEPDKCNIIYNSYQLRDDLFKVFGHFNGTVLHPMMPKLNRTKNGKYITLVNCNENKGGHIFTKLASRLPQYEFMGVFGGYGEQITVQAPNLRYLPNGTDMSDVYAQSRLVLVPSTFESFSQVALEAMICGIPVIANPTKGLKENLGDAGIFIDKNDFEKYVSNIVLLLDNKTAWQRQSDLCYNRSLCLFEKQSDELKRFDIWLSKIR